MRIQTQGIQRAKREQGFSLLEVVISMFVLTVGLVGLLGVFATALASTQTSQQDLIAKQLASEAMESIFTARNTSALSWDSIRNTTTAPGIFMPGFQPLAREGADGIAGTADDSGSLTLPLPGADGIVGTSDDVQLALTNYQRQIQIQDVLDAGGNVVPTLRTVNITIRYQTPQFRTYKTYVLSGYISQYR